MINRAVILKVSFNDKPKIIHYIDALTGTIALSNKTHHTTHDPPRMLQQCQSQLIQLVAMITL